MKRRLVVLAVAATLAFGSMIGVASATEEPPNPQPREHCDNGVGNGPDCRPGKAHFNNDDAGGVPGDPGSRGGARGGNAY